MSHFFCKILSKSVLHEIEFSRWSKQIVSFRRKAHRFFEGDRQSIALNSIRNSVSTCLPGENRSFQRALVMKTLFSIIEFAKLDHLIPGISCRVETGKASFRFADAAKSEITNGTEKDILNQPMEDLYLDHWSVILTIQPTVDHAGHSSFEIFRIWMRLIGLSSTVLHKRDDWWTTIRKRKLNAQTNWRHWKA